MPRAFRQDLAQLARKHNHVFDSKPELKPIAVRLFRALLRPQPKPRGRPRDPETTRGSMLYSRFRRKHPEEKPREIWDRVCRELYPQYAGLGELEQKDMREDLGVRVKSRSRSRRVRKSR